MLRFSSPNGLSPTTTTTNFCTKLINFLKMSVVQLFKSKGTLIPLLYIALILISYQYIVKSIQSIKIGNELRNKVSDASAPVTVTAADNANANQLHRNQRSVLQGQANYSRTKSQNGTDITSRRSDSTQIRSDRQDGVKIQALGSQNNTILYPWVGDEDCEHYSVQFAPHKTFKPRALVSFPGSGNSWLRYLIEGATGYFTGSIFHDKRIHDAGLLGEFRSPNDGSTIVQKSHHDAILRGTRKLMQAYVKLSELMFGYKGILLIRNPYEALLSYWNFRNTKSHKDVVPKPDLDTKGWKQFVEVGAQKWGSLIKDWVGNSMDLIIVLYEDLKENPKKELVKILHYLEQPIDHKRLDCVAKYVEGPFHRTEKPKSKASIASVRREPDQVAHNNLIQEHIKDVNLFLAQNLLPLHLNYTGSVL